MSGSGAGGARDRWIAGRERRLRELAEGIEREAPLFPAPVNRGDLIDERDADDGDQPERR